MRSAIIAAAFAAGALAVPHQKRAIVTQVDIDYVTEVVTVTAGQPLPTTAAAAAVTTLAAAAHFGNHDHIQAQAQAQPAPQVSSSVIVEAVVVAPSPAPAAPASQSFNVAVQPQQQHQQAAPSSQSSSGGSSSAPSSSDTSNSIVPSTSGGSYQDMVINSHNIHRANHSAPAIEWDDTLAATAQVIGETCKYMYQMDTNGGGYGQNIAAGLSPENVDKVITNMFYNGEVSWFNGLYGQANPNMGQFAHWGHFSQLVWKASTKVGCATVDCSSGGLSGFGDNSPYFTVCNYDSPGNFGGQYGDNIGEPLGHPTVVA